MNTSFNVVLNRVNVETVVNAINTLNVKTAIVNGSTFNHSNYGEVQTVTLLDCDRKTFNKIKNRVAVKSFFTTKSCY